MNMHISSTAPSFTTYAHDRLYRVLDARQLWPEMSATYQAQLPKFAPKQLPCNDANFEAVDAYNSEVAAIVTKGINAGHLAGSLALNAVDFIDCRQKVYHGSRVRPQDLREGKLLPHQATWGDPEGRRYRDGAPAVCFAPEIGDALFYAFLGPSIHELDGQFRARGNNVEGRSWALVSRAAIDAVAGATAVIYTALPEKVPAYASDQPGRAREHRSEHPTDYDFAVRVKSDLLPGDILVADAPVPVMKTMWQHMMRGGTPA